MKITVSSPIEETARVLQVRGLFDLAAEKTSGQEWDVEDFLPTLPPWSIGLITGPSGCGKSTIAAKLFPTAGSVWTSDTPPWPSHQSVIDGFPEGLSIKEVTELLGAVGFSSPPAWLRPYHVLSTGQKFRCDLARLLAVPGSMPRVFDEYTSVVDRTVARIGSAAVAKAVRSRKLKFVAVTCHEDVEEWLQPDWVYRPAENNLTRRSLRQRPAINLEVSRCSCSIWPLFAPHHYLSGQIQTGAWHFLACWENRPVAFSSWLPFVGSGPLARREHRTVVLPDYQGVGIGMALSGLIASMWRGLGYLARSTTTHPAFKRAREKSKDWKLCRAPSFSGGSKGRLTTGWEYIGPAMPRTQARALLAA